jgi:hypothetical protein
VDPEAAIARLVPVPYSGLGVTADHPAFVLALNCHFAWEAPMAPTVLKEPVMYKSVAVANIEYMALFGAVADPRGADQVDVPGFHRAILVEFVTVVAPFFTLVVV